MRKLLTFLFQIDKVVFEHWPVQIGLVVLWAALAFSGALLTWMGLGLAMYVILTVLNFRRHGIADEWNHMKELYSKHGSFPFFKGFNYCILLGPVSAVLALLMFFAPKEEQETEE